VDARSASSGRTIGVARSPKPPAHHEEERDGEQERQTRASGTIRIIGMATILLGTRERRSR
jgi:hypothetical protein